MNGVEFKSHEKQDNCIYLSPETVRRLCRYEMTSRDFLEQPYQDADRELVCRNGYEYTMDDLIAALHNLREADPTLTEFRDYWFDPIMAMYRNGSVKMLWEQFGMDGPEGLDVYHSICVSDSDLFWDIWNRMLFVVVRMLPQMPEGNLSWVCEFDFDMLFEKINQYFRNKGKPFEEWEFTKEDMVQLLLAVRDSDYLEEASEEELALARKFIEQLCAEDDTLALDVKGYACYGGNRLYPCDWEMSRDCMLRLLDITGDPGYANTLGYIYYYGRCNNRKPEYEKAYRYFTYAAANGIHEGMYKLGDLYKRGGGCVKSLSTAKALYSRVYEESKERLLQYFDTRGNFSDAAFRMGKLSEEEGDYILAYVYYLYADLAAHLRADESDFFGNKKVVSNVQEAKERMEQKMAEQGYHFYDNAWEEAYPFLLATICEDGHRVSVQREPREDGVVRLSVSRIPTKACPNPPFVLFPMPRLGRCALLKSYYTDALREPEIWFQGDADSVEYDYCEYNSGEQKAELYLGNDLVGTIRCEAYRTEIPAEEEM